MLMPKRVKRRKQFRGRMKGKAMRGNMIAYGEYGLVAQDPSWVTSQQIEAARIALTRYTRRGGQVWIKIFPDKPVTAKPAETRMGSGKGSPEYWVAVVKPGRVLFEVAGIDEAIAREALRLASTKLPMRTKIYSKQMEQTSVLTMMKVSEFLAMKPEELNANRRLKSELFNLFPPGHRPAGTPCRFRLSSGYRPCLTAHPGQQTGYPIRKEAGTHVRS